MYADSADQCANQCFGYFLHQRTWDSTPVGDKNETVAIRHTFNSNINDLLISSTKSMTGHLLGGAGGLESVFTVLSVFNDVVPPTMGIS